MVKCECTILAVLLKVWNYFQIKSGKEKTGLGFPPSLCEELMNPLKLLYY